MAAEASVTFITRYVADAFLDALMCRLAPTIRCTPTSDNDTRDTPTVFVFDGYTLPETEVEIARAAGAVTVRIEDRPGSYPGYDMIICHGPHACSEMFEVDPGCRLLLGPRYTLIAPDFYQMSGEPDAIVERVVVALGAGDHSALLAQVIGTIVAKFPDIKVEAVASQFVEDQSLSPFRENSRVVVHGPLKTRDLARLISRCDAAVVAGGGMCLESAALGMPSLLVAIAENQIAPCQSMHDRGLARYAGPLSSSGGTMNAFAHEFAAFVADVDGRAGYAEACRAMFRESGTDAVASEISALVQSCNVAGSLS
jgi:spore coat polysaccharide biosynthesis predicted glycosyltransferase SpsG